MFRNNRKGTERTVTQSELSPLTDGQPSCGESSDASDERVQKGDKSLRCNGRQEANGAADGATELRGTEDGGGVQGVPSNVGEELPQYAGETQGRTGSDVPNGGR